jgi:hypothetical protein
VTVDGAATAGPGQAQEELREEIDNPIQRLKLLSESDRGDRQIPRRDRGDEPARARGAARDLAHAPAGRAVGTIGWCGKPPKDETRTFVLISVGLTLGCWIIVPVLVGIALAT